MNPNTSALIEPMSPDEFDEMDAILDDLRTRYEETPQWEFCDGFLAALVCTRRVISPEDYWEVLLDLTPDGQGEGRFADAVQEARFKDLWTKRWTQVQTALDTTVESLDDERAFHPEVMDVRGAIAALSEEERSHLAQESLPAFAQVWALGFMFAVENWPQEWVAPRDKDAAKWLDASLQAIVALTEDDIGMPEVSPFTDDAPPTMSTARLDAFALAVWAVYDLRELWRSLGPRVETVRKQAIPGRNDLCHCGSGKKFKKCHGA